MFLGGLFMKGHLLSLIFCWSFEKKIGQSCEGNWKNLEELWL